MMRVWVMAALVWASSAGAVTIRLYEVAYAHITERSNGHVGGYYGSDPLELNQWFGQSTTVSLSNGVLTVLHQQSRGSNYAGIVLAPEVFGGQAGVYRLNFDVLDLVLNNTGKDQGVLGETHYGRVSVWSGQGYDLSQAVRAGAVGRRSGGDSDRQRWSLGRVAELDHDCRQRRWLQPGLRL